MLADLVAIGVQLIRANERGKVKDLYSRTRVT